MRENLIFRNCVLYYSLAARNIKHQYDQLKQIRIYF